MSLFRNRLASNTPKTSGVRVNKDLTTSMEPPPPTMTSVELDPNVSNSAVVESIKAGPPPPLDAKLKNRANEAAKTKTRKTGPGGNPPPGGGGGGGGGGNQYGGFLDPEIETWVRGLLGGVDTAGQEAFAAQQNEAARARAQADANARAGMAGMGLAGGNIAMAADIDTQSASALADQILGIQQAGREEDLRRGTVAAGILDQATQRRLQAEEIDKDDQFMAGILLEMGFQYDPETGKLVPAEEGPEPTAIDEADKAREENEQKAQQYAGVEEDLGSSLATAASAGAVNNARGGTRVDSYVDADGFTWVVYRDSAGKLYKVNNGQLGEGYLFGAVGRAMGGGE